MQRVLALLCCLLMLLLSQCSTGKEGEPKRGQKAKPIVPVAVAKSSKKTVPVEIVATGHVEASATAEIRSQVTGILKSVHFKEGDGGSWASPGADYCIVGGAMDIEEGRGSGGRHALGFRPIKMK